ncbi:MAG: insulinase family protein [Chlamydiales bacterium]|nr:insulinase family protein [Chlamydiales bacterium]
MRLWFLVAVVFSATILHAGDDDSATIIKDTNPLKILSPTLKDVQTLKLKLKNGLAAYIISDPEARESAAALAVEAGSWNDPAEYPGTAHFLEHMLFMGSAKYPTENEMSQYLGDNHGFANAYTSTDRTVYMFSVNNNAFAGAVDRFSHFFIDPLFLLSGVKKELHAVDQEHDKNLENDGWRSWYVFKETGNLSHPNHSFSTGNAKTLGEIPPETLRKWFTEHYSSDKMHLVIYSSEDIESLKQMVIQHFSLVKQAQDFAFPSSDILSDKQRGKIIYIEPVKELREVTIEWKIPEDLADSAATQMVAYFLSDKSEHSIYHQLESAGLLESINAGTERLSKHHALFTIQFSLTKEGIKQLHQILNSTFQALHFLKDNSLPSYYYDECKSMQIVNYQFQSRSNAFAIVGQHASALIDEPFDSYPFSKDIMGPYSPKNLEQLLECLTPKKMVVFVLAPADLTGVNPDHKEKWLGGEYCIVDLNEELETLAQVTANSSINYPPANPFIPKNLSIVSPISSTEEKVPKLLKEEEMGMLYYMQDSTFLTPELSVNIGIKTPLIDGDAKNSTCLDLYLYGIGQLLTPIASQAGIAGLYSNVSISDMTLQLSVSGYSEKALFLLEEIIKQSKSHQPSIDEFNLYKEAITSQYENQSMNLPLYSANEVLSSILFNDAPTSQQKLKIIKRLSYEDYLKYNEELFKQVYIEMLCYGNVTQDAIEKSFNKTKSIFQATPYALSEQVKAKVLLLSEKEGPFQINLQSKLQGNATILAIENGSFTFEKSASQLVVNLALDEAFFDELRTKQQTGYIVQSVAVQKYQQLMQLFAVQSSTHYPTELLARFELFLEEYLKNLTSHITKERFDKLKESLITKLSAPAKNLDEQAHLFYAYAFVFQGDFDRKQKQIQAIEELSYDRFLSDCELFFSRNNGKRIAVLVEGKPTENKSFKYNRISQELLKQSGTYVSAH